MKLFLMLTWLIAFGMAARATPLQDKIKAFDEALKTSITDKTSQNSMMSERILATIPDDQSPGMGEQSEANLEAMVKQMMIANSSAALQAAGNALLAELDVERKARVDALTNQANAVLVRIPDILIKAKKTEELDGILDDLQKVSSPRTGVYGYDPESQTVMNRINSAYQFVSQWQDYLSALNSGNNQEAQNVLRNLSNSHPAGDPILVPRSEILTRISTLDASAKTTSPSTAGYASSIEQNAILKGIKKLEDIHPALDSLRLTQGPNWSRLSQMENLYEDAKNGLPVTLGLNSLNYMGSETSPELERIKSILLLYLIPRYIGSEALTPNPNETVNDFFKRSIEAAEANQDLVTLLRVVQAQSKISNNQVVMPGTQSFLAGMNREMAGQYTLAVISYQSALQDPDDSLLSKIVGDRLTALKNDHPAEFEEGMKRFLNPPTSTYLNPYAMRAGLPGAVYPTIPTTGSSLGMPSGSAIPALTNNPSTSAPTPTSGTNVPTPVTPVVK